MMLGNIMNDPMGRIIISALLGLGLASIFRKVCSGSSCVVVHGPHLDDTKKYFYKIDEDCYKYTPYATQCATFGNAQ